jgi:thiol-disulfide isomerase/thioredoxin
MLFCLATFVRSVIFGPNVLTLTGAQFSSVIDRRGNMTVAMVMFHGDHCPACRQAYPEYTKAADEAAGMIIFGEVDTDLEPSLARRFDIYGIPAFYIFHPGGQVQFLQAPQTREFLNAASRYIPRMGKEADESWYPNGASRAAILFTDKRLCPPLWAAISCAWHNSSVRIGQTTNATLRSKFNISSVPMILMIDRDHQMIYDGSKTFTDIHNAFTKYFSDEPKPASLRMEI